ncbi:MAG: hypothetical protein JW974_02505 [Alphaproteobacteria bacterium]|nr:hypothetical protein [Alphaproteobacteria bacterium]MBN2675168.1 hypothetical protein [Alphaproteobacteria bacterium]
MKLNTLTVKFTIDDLNEFAPKGVKFRLTKSGLIDTFLPDYKNKYPEIDSANNIFFTGLGLRDLETDVGNFINLSGKQVPVGFENKTEEEIFQDSFRDRKDELFPKDGFGQKQNIAKRIIPIDINMRTQVIDLDEYGRLGQEYQELTNLILKSEIEIKVKKDFEPKSNWFGKYDKWLKSCNDIYLKKKEFEKKRNEVNIDKTRIFYGLTFDPKGILAFAFKKAAIAKIREILKTFESYKEDGTLDKIEISERKIKELGVLKNEESGVINAEKINNLKKAKYNPLFVTRSENFPEIEDMNATYSVLVLKKQLTPKDSKLLLEIVGVKKR